MFVAGCQDAEVLRQSAFPKNERVSAQNSPLRGSNSSLRPFNGKSNCLRTSTHRAKIRNKHNTKSFSWTGVSHDDELNRNFLRMRKRRRYIRTEILPSNQLHESGLLHNLHRLFIHMREYQRNSLIFTYFCQVK